MSKLNEVQQRLSEIDATKFHKMVDVYLSKKYNYQIHSTGTKIGEDKPRKGTPDTLITLDNGNYIFVEYTAQKTKIKDKFLDDIEKCLDSKKTGIEKTKIEKIILACNSSLQSNDIDELQNGCQGIVCEVITNSTLSYDLVNHYPTVAKDFLGIDIGNILTPNFLKEKYKSKNFTNIKTLSLGNVNIQNIYQDLSIFKKAKDDKKKDYYKEIEIDIDQILDDSQKVAVLGKSGVGKSTLAKYICYQWAEDKLFNNYEYLFYIPIKKWEKGEGIFDVILKILKESINENIKIKADDLYDYIQKSFNDKTLFIIDGLDEIGIGKREDIKKEIQNFNNYIITSRHNGLGKNEFNIGEVFENSGFNQNSIEKFIAHIPNSSELKKEINNKGQLRELSKIPMLLDMICYLNKEDLLDFNNNFTMTSLYDSFLDEIILRFEEERESEAKEIQTDDNDIFLKLGEIELSLFFR